MEEVEGGNGMTVIAQSIKYIKNKKDTGTKTQGVGSGVGGRGGWGRG